MLVTKSELDTRFAVHVPHPRQSTRCEAIRRGCRELATTILERVPDSREQSLALTKLEEVMFWANAGIARGDPNWKRP